LETVFIKKERASKEEGGEEKRNRGKRRDPMFVLCTREVLLDLWGGGEIWYHLVFLRDGIAKKRRVTALLPRV